MENKEYTAEAAETLNNNEKAAKLASELKPEQASAVEAFINGMKAQETLQDKTA